jgi:hypothetical protein
MVFLKKNSDLIARFGDGLMLSHYIAHIRGQATAPVNQATSLASDAYRSRLMAEAWFLKIGTLKRLALQPSKA